MKGYLRSLLVIACIVAYSYSVSFCQCTAILSTQNTCIPAGLRISSNSIPSKIVWKKENVDVKTVYQSWDKNGQFVCGSPAIGNNMLDIFVDTVGTIYLTDVGNHAIIKWMPGADSGIVVAGGNGQGANANQFNYPYGVFVDAAGNIFVADMQNNRVQKWAPGAVSGITVAGGHGQGTAANQLSGPTNVFVTASGQIYIADFGNNRIQRWAPGASSGVTVASSLGQPFDVCVDGSGNMYIAEYYKITRWNSGAASGTTLVSGSSKTAVQMNLVRTVAGDIYYNKDSSVYRLLNGATTPTVIAGGRSGISADRLTEAVSLGVDAFGSLYCLDLFGKSRVLRYQPNTDTTFIAANAGSYTAVVTSLKGCSATSNAQVFSATAGPTLQITAPLSPVCQGKEITFTTSHTNGGAFPGFQWRKNGITVAAGSGYSSYTSSNLNNGDIMMCTVTDNGTLCNARDTLVVQVRPTIQTGQFYAGGNCLPSNIVLKGSFPSAVTWKLDNMVVDSFLVHWKSYGSIVAGGNGLGNNLNQLKYPRRIQVDDSGNIYVLDTQNDRVVKYTPGAASGILVAGGNGPGAALNQLKSPEDFHITSAGDIYIVDGSNNRVVKWSPGADSGVVVVNNSGFGLGVFRCVFVDSKGDIYVSWGSDIYKVLPDGVNRTLVAGGNGTGSANTQLNNPLGIFVDDDGFIYIADGLNHRVMKWKDGVSYGKVAGTGVSGNGTGQLNSPEKVFVDAAKKLYVLDYGNHRLQRYAPGTSSGETVLNFSVSNPGALNPTGFAFDNQNNLYVVSSSDSKALKFPSTTPSLKADTAGIYTVKLSGMASGCYSEVEPIVLNDLQGPSLSLKSAPVCTGDMATVIALPENAGANPSIAWQKNNQLSNEASNTFRDSATSNGDVIGIKITKIENNCYVIDSAITVIKPSPLHQLSAVIGTPSTITLQSNMVLPQINWLWNNQPLDTTHNWKSNAITVAAGGYDGLFVDRNGYYFLAGGQGVLRRSVGSANATIIVPGGCCGMRDVWRAGDSLYSIWANTAESPTVLRHSIEGGAGTVVAGRLLQHGSADSLLAGPRELYVNENRDIYIADPGNSRVQKWSRGAKVGTTVSSGINPMGVTADSDDNVFFPNYKGFSNLLLRNKGAVADSIIASVQGVPEGIFRDPNGNIYMAVISDEANKGGSIMRWTPENNSLRYVAGNAGTSNAANQLNQPTDVGLDEFGNIFVADPFNNRVQLFTADSFKTRTVNNPGVYSITATAYNGCSVKDSITIYSGIYVFIGPGTDWNDPSNWQGGNKPPANLPEWTKIEINPVNGECIVNSLHVAPNTEIRIPANKKLTILH